MIMLYWLLVHVHVTSCSDIGGAYPPNEGVAACVVSDRQQEKEEEEDELDLVYDAELNCFLDPSTGKYYELIT